MKKIFSLLLVVTLIVLLPTVVLSAKNIEQNQNRGQIQNQKEETELAVENQEQEKNSKEAAPRSDKAQEQMSEVAKKVEELLTAEGQEGGIGKEISEFAKQQQGAQRAIKENLARLEARQGILKTLFGPDKEALKKLKQQAQQTRLRIKKLEKLQNRVTNDALQTQIKETLSVLKKQNTTLLQQISQEEEKFSFFGWFKKLFAK